MSSLILMNIIAVMILKSTNSNPERIVGGFIAKQGQSLFFKAALAQALLASFLFCVVVAVFSDSVHRKLA